MSSTPSIWPSAPILLDESVKQTIHRFFSISDSTDPTSGRLFAEELFAEDALRRVFCADSPASDVLVHGMFKIDLKDGQIVELDFNARFIMGEEAKIKFLQVWTDPTGMVAALKKAGEGVE
ncbi:hypothetical protein SLS60_008704 [Paraconiothyrium brasiliense]|uniref:SnoaL-like domain-containing protein n=1 Tax=Paraconiothyrium brasiliense TaxID=300254 RepID=A0ABR3QY90_9PLEO